MSKKFILALSLVALPSIQTTAQCPIAAAGDMVTYGLIADKTSKLSWVKAHPRATALLAAFSTATFLYGPATKNWGKVAWKNAMNEGVLSEATVDAAFSAAAMTTLGLLTVNTGIKAYKGAK